MLTRILAMCAVALFATFGSADRSKAASIFIDADNLVGQVAFSFGQFEGGFSINGSTPITTGGSVFPDGTQLNFTGQWIDLGAAVAFSRTVYWVNPSTPSTTAEILQWNITPSGASGLATISGSFNGASGLPVPPGTAASNIIVKQSNGSHNPFNFSAAFLGGQVIADSPPPVPLPAAGWLLFSVLGFGALIGRRRTAPAA